MYDVVVIGSGYGGSVIAARLAGHRRLLLVERGRRWPPPSLPAGLTGLARTAIRSGNPQGLWGMRFGHGTGVAFASAFGGSSPVNYGITTTPDDEVFDGWPVGAAALAPFFARARAVLRPEANPIAATLGDQQFLDLVEPSRRVDLENTIDWEHCSQCGRCVPGCRSGAKRPLDRTYLRLAEAAGAEVRTATNVQSIAPLPEGGWELIVRPTGGTERDDELVLAREVVVAAGTLGTLDLLDRSRARLPISPWLGRGMSLNGDGLAFLYDTRHRLSSHHGAPISTSVRLRFTDRTGRSRGLMVMSGRVPMAAMRVAGGALALAAELLRDRDAHSRDGGPSIASRLTRLRDLVSVRDGGALSRSFMFKLDGQDASRGIARFTPSGVVIDWNDYAADPAMQFAASRLRGWAAKVGGTVVPNVAELPGMRSFSVHPLGGCRMAASARDGVVDDVGRVFDLRGGTWPGLRIADGSIIPDALGVPPSLTISALAERIADDMLRREPVAPRAGCDRG